MVVLSFPGELISEASVAEASDVARLRQGAPERPGGSNPYGAVSVYTTVCE